MAKKIYQNLEYANDNSSNFNSNSLVNSTYVINQITNNNTTLASSGTAGVALSTNEYGTNGVSKNNGAYSLGGTLAVDTILSLNDTNQFIINGNSYQLLTLYNGGNSFGQNATISVVDTQSSNYSSNLSISALPSSQSGQFTIAASSPFAVINITGTANVSSANLSTDLSSNSNVYRFLNQSHVENTLSYTSFNITNNVGQTTNTLTLNDTQSIYDLRLQHNNSDPNTYINMSGINQDGSNDFYISTSATQSGTNGIYNTSTIEITSSTGSSTAVLSTSYYDSFSATSITNSIGIATGISLTDNSSNGIYLDAVRGGGIGISSLGGGILSLRSESSYTQLQATDGSSVYYYPRLTLNNYATSSDNLVLQSNTPNSANNTTVNSLVFERALVDSSPGTGEIGIGSNIYFRARNNNTNSGSFSANAGISYALTNVTSGSEEAALTISTVYKGSQTNIAAFSGTSGLAYSTDFSAGYTSRSLIDKSYFLNNQGVVNDTSNTFNTVTDGITSWAFKYSPQGPGSVTLTNGSANIVGNGTTFTDPAGLSFWTSMWINDGVAWYYINFLTVNNNTSATMSVVYTRSQYKQGATQWLTTWPGLSGTYKYYYTLNFSDGDLAIAGGLSTYASSYSTALGSFAIAGGGSSFSLGFFNYAGGQFGSMAQGLVTYATGQSALSTGAYTIASGSEAFSGGLGLQGAGTAGQGLDMRRMVRAAGVASFNFSQNNASATVNTGAMAANSAILGGLNHSIVSTSAQGSILGGSTGTISGTSTNSAIIGGSSNTVNGVTNTVVLGGSSITASQASFVYVPSLNINTAPLIVATTTASLMGRSSTGNIIQASIAGTNGIGVNTANGALFINTSIVGDKSGSTPTAGYLSEFISAGTAGAGQSLTNNTIANVAALINLQPGDWDVFGNVNFTETSATVTARSAGISSTIATVPTDGSQVYLGTTTTTTTTNNSIVLPRKRFNISTQTTIYMTAQVAFSAGTVSAFGFLNARRVR